MKLKLKQQYLLVILSIIILTVVILSSGLIWQNKKLVSDISESSSKDFTIRFIEQFEQRGRVLILFLVEDLIDPLYLYDMETIYLATKTTRDQKDVEYVYVYDSELLIVQDGTDKNEQLNQKLNNLLSTKSMADQELKIRIIDNIIEFAAPIKFQDEVLGGITLGLSMKGINKNIREMNDHIDTIQKRSLQRNIFHIITIGLFLSLIGIIIARIISQTMSRPIERLSTITEQVGQGNYDIDITTRRNDEIGDLIRSLIKMTDDLREKTVGKYYVDEIIRNMTEMLIVITDKGTITKVNQSACNLLEYVPDELINRNLDTLFVNKSNSTIKNILTEIEEQKRITAIEKVFLTKSNNEIPILFSGSQMRDANGELQGIVCIAVDITERIRAEKKLEKAMDALWGEMELAKKIQTVLLPENPEIPGFEITATMTPADNVGGDYYDIINTDNMDWLIIGDVSGHGVPAGLIMMMVQTSIHTIIQQNLGLTPSELLTIVNKTISQNIKQIGSNKYMTITVLAAHKEGRFHFSGVHQNILIYRSREKKVDVIETNGMWIGILPDIKDLLQDNTLELKNNDVMLLYTDGITEAWSKNTDNNGRNEESMFGEETLKDALLSTGEKSSEAIKDNIINRLSNYRTDDDITLVVIKRT